MDVDDALLRLVGGPLDWLHQGHTPVARTPAGILRMGPARIQQRELDARHPALAPAILATHVLGDHIAILEADLGQPSPATAMDALEQLHRATPRQTQTLQGTAGELLQQVRPWAGRVKLTPFIRALRAAKKAGAPLPFPPNQQRLQRALATPLTVEVSVGWIHGAVRPGRTLERGLCHWRNARPDGHRAADRASLLAVPEASPAERLYIVAQSLRADPVRAAAALAALGLGLGSTASEATLHASGHPGLSRAALETMLGCALGTPSPAAAVARALGRAQRLSVAGVPIQARSEPPLPPRKDPRFWMPRDRDPRRLFSRWGAVRLEEDAQARYSLTPEAAALRIADRMAVRGKVVVDGFCGAGGNAIAFARRGARVIAIDTDAQRLAMARHNAEVYGVTERIQFVRGDFFAAPASGDLVFLDPPWDGGVALLEAAWAAGRARFAAGTIKLPRDHGVDERQQLVVHHTPEGFPAFLTCSWA